MISSNVRNPGRPPARPPIRPIRLKCAFENRPAVTSPPINPHSCGVKVARRSRRSSPALTRPSRCARDVGSPLREPAPLATGEPPWESSSGGFRTSVPRPSESGPSLRELRGAEETGTCGGGVKSGISPRRPMASSDSSSPPAWSRGRRIERSQCTSTSRPAGPEPSCLMPLASLFTTPPPATPPATPSRRAPASTHYSNAATAGPSAPTPPALPGAGGSPTHPA